MLYLVAGMASGFTLPQSAPLKVDVLSTVNSTGAEFAPLCIVPVTWYVPCAVVPSGQEDCIVA